MKYRRRHGSDTWHWCTNCSEWPTAAGSYVEEDLPAGQRPSDGELDNQCLGKERNNDCQTAS
jgi:hypothetical protein